MSVVAAFPRMRCAVVEVAYSIAGVVTSPVETSFLARALSADSLDQALYGGALDRRGWRCLVDAIDTARDALHEALAGRGSMEHLGGSTWKAVVPAVRDQKELSELLERARATMRRRAPGEHAVVVGMLTDGAEVADASSRVSGRIQSLLHECASRDRVSVVAPRPRLRRSA
jgi:hypothetical protein